MLESPPPPSLPDGGGCGVEALLLFGQSFQEAPGGDVARTRKKQQEPATRCLSSLLASAAGLVLVYIARGGTKMPVSRWSGGPQPLLRVGLAFLVNGPCVFSLRVLEPAFLCLVRVFCFAHACIARVNMVHVARWVLGSLCLCRRLAGSSISRHHSALKHSIPAHGKPVTGLSWPSPRTYE
ncbi:hypothetical protein NDU88_000818 [Pleurodeles waltl]|uniref:Uncharacterized protein n=1 Tax=Pleurodeles waltl TaxID=8319 RepID=A0AAV7LZ71_PLEWA|nr:hypothetical protein NDU88_000818 [Pleurodeles waltl]